MASPNPVTGTFLFADIAGYTALTEAHGDADAAELALAFCGELSDVARARGGEVVKTIGDAVMVRHADPCEAVALGLIAAHELLAGHGSPAVRVGMHHGPALRRDGDWFGGSVNLAARVAALAAGGEVLLTGSVRDRLGELRAIRLEPRGEQRVRNMTTPVPLFAAVPADAGGDIRHLDPVCHMLVDEAHAVGMLQHRDAVYRFCSLECAGRFARDPELYAAQ